eukprot:TRINITY_DN8338_c0_g1_i1.p1 TRINITY_DN8338_c0_g1~~TRINITY_DN8338_c0_g1_i1.p1  ORF type:complete len:379 (-),score=76.55 TRINITY_DN8338_c0_g1_i1:30-1166(-)
MTGNREEVLEDLEKLKKKKSIFRLSSRKPKTPRHDKRHKSSRLGSPPKRGHYDKSSSSSSIIEIDPPKKLRSNRTPNRKPYGRNRGHSVDAHVSRKIKPNKYLKESGEIGPSPRSKIARSTERRTPSQRSHMRHKRSKSARKETALVSSVPSYEKRKERNFLSPRDTHESLEYLKAKKRLKFPDPTFEVSHTHTRDERGITKKPKKPKSDSLLLPDLVPSDQDNSQTVSKKSTSEPELLSTTLEVDKNTNARPTVNLGELLDINKDHELHPKKEISSRRKRKTIMTHFDEPQTDGNSISFKSATRLIKKKIRKYLESKNSEYIYSENKYTCTIDEIEFSIFIQLEEEGNRIIFELIKGNEQIFEEVQKSFRDFLIEMV